MGHSTGRLSILWLLGLCLLLFKAGYTEAQSKRSSRVTSSRSFGTNVKTSSSNGLSFDCPEEFGYYPHPTDCTQYYVCVFGGALLESCTGGLMYSHELQTCDWPRNVGCELVDTSSSSERGPSRSQAQTQTQQHVPSRVRFGSAFSSPGAGASKVPTVAPQYHRSPPQVIQAQVQHIPPPPELRVPPNPVVTSRGQPKPLLDSQEDIAKLYAEAQETLPPVEEEESDRQQRVYRGQPSTVSQVQRDRDGIIHQASINAIPQAGKIGSYAFGTAYRVESSSPSSLGAPPPPANIFVQPTPQAQPQPQELSRNYYNASIFNHGSGSGGGYQQHQQQQVPQHQQQLQPTPFQQAQVQQAPQQQPPHQQQQAQAPPHPYDSSYYSIYDDDIDLYRDIEYQQQQQQDQREQQQQQQPPPAAQYQPVVRQQQTQSTYRPIELAATPTPPQKASYGNQPTLVYSTDYDEDVNAQIEQDNVYDQPTRSPPRPEQVAIQRLATPSSAPSSTTPAARPDIRTYYDTLTTPDGPGLSQPDYSYSSSAEYAYGSPEDYDQSEATLTRTKPRSEADDYDLSANVVGPTGKSATAAPTRAKNSKSTPAIDRSPTKSSSFPTTQAVKVTKPTTTTTTTTTTSTTTPPPSTTTPKSSKAHANKPHKPHVPQKSKTKSTTPTPATTTTPQAPRKPPTTTTLPKLNPSTYSSNPFLKSKLQSLAQSLVSLVSPSQSSPQKPTRSPVPASPPPPSSTTQWPFGTDSAGSSQVEQVETVFDESQNVQVHTAEAPSSRSFETSTAPRFLDFINAAAYGTSPRGNLLHSVSEKPVKPAPREALYRPLEENPTPKTDQPQQRKRIQTYILSDVEPQSFRIPGNERKAPSQEELMESSSTSRPNKHPIQYSLQSGSHGFSLFVEQDENRTTTSTTSTTTTTTTTTPATTPQADSSDDYVEIVPTTYAPPLRIWRNGRPTIQQGFYRPTTSSPITTSDARTPPPALFVSNTPDSEESSSTLRSTTVPRAQITPSTEKIVGMIPSFTARANFLKDSLNKVTPNPATRFVSPYKSLENLLQEERQHQHNLRTTSRPRYTNAPASPPFLQTTPKPPKSLFLTPTSRNTSQDVLATMASGNARNFSVSDAILSTFSPQRPAPTMLRTTSTTTTSTTTTEPPPPTVPTTTTPTTVSSVVASLPLRVSQLPGRPRGRSRYTVPTSNSLGDVADEPTTYAPRLRLPNGYEPSPYVKRKPQRIRVFREPTAKPQEKYEVYKAALKATDSSYDQLPSKSLKRKPIENEASLPDEPRAEALISHPLEARQQNSLEETVSSTEHVVAITERPTVKFLYSNKYRQQTAERTLAESLQNAGYISRAQKFRSANVLEQLKQFLAGSDSSSTSDESGTSHFVDEYAVPEINAAVDEIKHLYLTTEQSLRSTTLPVAPPRSTAVTSSPKSYSSQPSTAPTSTSTVRTTTAIPELSTPRTPPIAPPAQPAPPNPPTPASASATVTATPPATFALPTARASRVNNVIKSSIAAVQSGASASPPSPAGFQPQQGLAAGKGKVPKFQFGFDPSISKHSSSSISNPAAAAAATSASVKCSDSTLNAKCNEIPSRNNNRNRGSAIYTNQDRDVVSTPNRGTHPPRTRPTLKPSGTIVSKAQEFVDIYRNPPSRPDPIYPQPTPDKTAAKCRKDVCLLPDCYCGGKDIPGELPVESIPQIVLLTFDDSVNDLNKQLYTDLFEKGRVNPNGCPITATFYVSHEWTDYSQVQNLYADGHEMASHTVSHSFGEQFSQKKWTREIAGQREILAAYGGVKLSDVRGMRAPFLSVGGNKMYKMLYDSNFTYDSSMPVYENRPPSWPYTLDYKIFHDCMIPPCPTRSYPGVWQVPMVMWQDLNGGRCSMGDACSNPSDAEGVTKMIMKNFERHYTTNRAPFGLFYHAAWFTQPHHKEGFIKFLDAINAMPDVWIVTNWQALQWVRDPTPISRINSFQPFQCDYSDRPKRCNNPKVCNLWHKSGVRYMKTCQPCPDIYPWTGKSGIRSSRIDNEVEEPAP
ncbi:hypothetical protein KR074_010235 [Drosophila pseudoananassae]|nr:hypothetical protein KR074_010235 [Drosophila pseudoananassae]